MEALFLFLCCMAHKTARNNFLPNGGMAFLNGANYMLTIKINRPRRIPEGPGAGLNMACHGLFLFFFKLEKAAYLFPQTPDKGKASYCGSSQTLQDKAPCTRVNVGMGRLRDTENCHQKNCDKIISK